MILSEPSDRRLGRLAVGALRALTSDEVGWVGELDFQVGVVHPFGMPMASLIQWVGLRATAECKRDRRQEDQMLVAHDVTPRQSRHRRAHAALFGLDFHCACLLFA